MKRCVQCIVLGWTAVFLLAGCQADRVKPASSDLPPTVDVEPQSDWLDPETIVFASTPYFGVGLLTDEFEPFVGYLSEKLGRPTELRTVDSYEKMIELIKTQEVHLGVLSPLSYVRAKKSQPDLKLLASQVANGATTYSYTSSLAPILGILDLQALAGKRFGFVDKLSTSGYLYPMAELKGLGIEPSTFFSRWFTLGIMKS